MWKKWGRGFQGFGSQSKAGDYICVLVSVCMTRWCVLGQVNNWDTGREKVVDRACHPEGRKPSCHPRRKKVRTPGSRRRWWEIVEVQSSQDKEIMLEGGWGSRATDGRKGKKRLMVFRTLAIIIHCQRIILRNCTSRSQFFLFIM